MYNLNVNTIKSANIVLETLHAKISACVVPPFGSNMLLNNSGTNNEDIVLATVKHRIVNKFEPSDTADSDILRDACMAKWVAYESTLRDNAIYSREHGNSSVYRRTWWDGLTPETKKVLFKARELCHNMFSDFSVDLHNTDVEFTPGETNVSSGGRVSIEEKLKSLSNWTVTADAADDFARLCYHNYSLKSAIKRHFRALTRQELRDLHFECNNSGFEVFKTRFDEVVTIVPGSVGDSVPKNRTTRRFINKEPMGNMLLQRLPARVIRRAFSDKFVYRKNRRIINPLYNPLDDGQMRHKQMISFSGVSTVDWSNASDSIHRDGTKFLFPGKLNRLLEKWRSPMVLISYTDNHSEWHIPEKLCSMGNGFCFEVLTLVLLSLARVLDPHASVYGDDVIINDDAVDAFVLAAQSLGFSLNSTKSFIKSPFRESCGGFYYEPIGYITSFDFLRCETETDIITSANKISSIIISHPFLRDLMMPTWKALKLLIPTSRIGPFPPLSQRSSMLSMYLWDNGYKGLHMCDATQRRLRKKLIEHYSFVLESLHLGSDASTLNKMFHNINVIETAVFRPKAIGRTPDHVKCPFKRALYMYAGRRTKNTLRPKPSALDNAERRGDWVTNLYFVLPSGQMLSLKELERIRKETVYLFMIASWDPQFQSNLNWMALVS